MEEKLAAYYRYYESEYAKIIGLADLELLAKEKNLQWLVEASKKFSYPFSSVWRHETVANIKYIMSPRKTDQICTVFKISRLRDKKQFTTTYAIMYSHLASNITHDYVALSPTYRSADGEYRHRFVPVRQIIQHRIDYSEHYEPVEQHLAQQAQDGLITLQTITEGLDAKQMSKFQRDIDKKRFVLMFYSAVWFPEFDRKMKNKSENHIVEGYHEAMFGPGDVQIWTNDKEFLQDPLQHAKFYNRSMNILPTPKQHIVITEAGQKIVPLTTMDVESADDIRLAPWREMYITSLVGDLIVNGICPGVPILGDWFFIKNAVELFDNAVSHAKLKHSEVASDIVRRLELARRNTYILDPIRNKEVYLSYRMEGLSEAVEIPMQYAEREIILADHVLVAVEEHLGRTVGDLPILMTFETYQNDIGPIFSDYLHFAKYMFEFHYALCSLNSIGIVHGDPHINNITIFKTRIRIHTKGTSVKAPHILFRVQDDLYLFPTANKQAAFIDFSRGFIWNLETLAKDFSESQIQNIKQHYRGRIIDSLASIFPDYITSHSANIELALVRSFDDVYNAFQLVDTYRVMYGWEHLIRSRILTDPKALKTYANHSMLVDRALPLVCKIKDAAYRLFTQTMDIIIAAQPGSKPINLNKRLLQESFKEFALQPDAESPATLTLVDYWSDQNTMQYNIREYDKFPPTVKFDYAVKHKIPIDEFRISGYNIAMAYQSDHDPIEAVAALSNAYKAAKADRRGTPHAFDKKQETINDKLLPAASSDDIYYSS
jgi:hypothetical protein